MSYNTLISATALQQNINNPKWVAHAVVIPLLFVEVSRKKGQRGFFGEFGIRGLARWLFHDAQAYNMGYDKRGHTSNKVERI